MSDTGPGLSIGEVARRSGVRASTLRCYEAIGLLPAPARVSGRRAYDTTILDRLTVISTARRAGLTLAEVGRLLAGMAPGGAPGDAWRTMASRKLPEVDRFIEHLHQVRHLLSNVAACECHDMGECAAALRGEGRVSS